VRNKLVNTTLIVLCLAFAQEALATSVASEQAKFAIELLKTACVSGDQVKIEGDAEGGLSLFKLKPGAEGEVRFSYQELRGMVDATNEAIIVEENRRIRECMQPYIQQIIAIIANDPKNVPPEGTGVLPKNQLMPVGVPLPILDGKVTVLVSRVYEAGRKIVAEIHVDVPKRNIYRKKLLNAQTLSFEYFGFQYKLTMTEPDIQRETVNITIIAL
jgi:hypothetical protein